MHMPAKSISVALTLYVICVTGGCSGSTAARTDRAAHMERAEFNAAPFILTGWQKVSQNVAPVHLYIEGDGSAWTGRARISPNPTPKNPVALMLAAQDISPNVVYLGRPCQYTAFNKTGNEACANPDYWTGKRFAEEVVQSYMTVLDNLARNHTVTEFYVTGYSGGANIAGLLAARRTDIVQLKTVAGNLDNDYFTRLHKVSDMPHSLNMADYAGKLSTIPQMHFIGADDDVVPPAIYESYATKAGNTSCLQYRIIPDTDHHDGWEKTWPALRDAAIACNMP